jgi:DNA-directed RNA polymerase sigma subunit (sigma70/sigma32)
MPSMREARDEELEYYYADKAHCHRLSQAEARNLLAQIALAQEQEDHAREACLKQHLIESYLGYVMALVTRYRRPFSAATTFADLVQEGNLAFVEVV